MGWIGSAGTEAAISGVRCAQKLMPKKLGKRLVTFGIPAVEWLAGNNFGNMIKELLNSVLDLGDCWSRGSAGDRFDNEPVPPDVERRPIKFSKLVSLQLPPLLALDEGDECILVALTWECGHQCCCCAAWVKLQLSVDAERERAATSYCGCWSSTIYRL